MKILKFSVTGCIKCCDCGPEEIVVGKKVMMDLDNSRVTNLPDKLIGTVILVTQATFAGVSGRIYDIEYDETKLLPSSLLELRVCDILGVPRCLTCCDELGIRIDNLADTKVTEVLFNNTTRVLTVKDSAGAVFTATIPDADVDTNTFLVSAVFNNGTRQLTLTQNNGTVFNVIIPDTDKFLVSSAFNNTTRQLTLTQNDGSTTVATIPDADTTNDYITYSVVTSVDPQSLPLGTPPGTYSILLYDTAGNPVIGQPLTQTAYTNWINNGCGIGLSQTFFDGNTFPIGPVGFAFGAANTNSDASSVIGNQTGQYTEHTLRGENDGGALNTPTPLVAQKVFVEETKANACTRNSKVSVEDWVGNTVFVDGVHGSANGQAYRSDKPFQTIQQAADAATAGDLVKVHAGVYEPFNSANVNLEMDGVTVTGGNSNFSNGRITGRSNFTDFLVTSGDTQVELGQAKVFVQNGTTNLEMHKGWVLVNQGAKGNIHVQETFMDVPSGEWGSVFFANAAAGSCANVMSAHGTNGSCGVSFNRVDNTTPINANSWENALHYVGGKVTCDSSNAFAAFLVQGVYANITCNEIRSLNANIVGLRLANSASAKVNNAKIISSREAIGMGGGAGATGVQDLVLSNVTLISGAPFAIEVTNGSFGRRVWSYNTVSDKPLPPTVILMAGTSLYVNPAII